MARVIAGGTPVNISSSPSVPHTSLHCVFQQLPETAIRSISLWKSLLRSLAVYNLQVREFQSLASLDKSATSCSSPSPPPPPPPPRPPPVLYSTHHSRTMKTAIFFLATIIGLFITPVVTQTYSTCNPLTSGKSTCSYRQSST